MSEYTCGLRYVKPKVLNTTSGNFFLLMEIFIFNLFISLRILFQIKCNKKINSSGCRCDRKEHVVNETIINGKTF